MNTVILHSESRNDINLLIKIARKIGIKAKVLKESEIEEIGLGNAIKEGDTGEFIDTEAFLEKLCK